ncbi:MAG TPA: replicative DNA helicase [Candidatus Sulfotelmatobacter sp.]|nr:replicative DNA helicase [Candidatus Sulfotelmatobacter sp.]
MDPARPVTPLNTALNANAAERPYRVMPHNLDAEQELLGAILVNNDAAAKVSGFLEAAHFANNLHARIYEAALKLIERGEIATPITLKAYFERDQALADIGGTAYLARLAAAATSIINAEQYGRTVYDLALRREIIRIGEDMVNTAYEATVDDPAREQIENAEQQLFALAERGAHEGGFQSFAASLTQSIQMIDAAYRRDGLSGVGTGLRDLDSKLGGLHRSDLIILAGRPSMGKTALATIVAFNAAKEYHDTKGGSGAVVGFFSLEMSAEQLATRILSTETRIPSHKLRRGEISDDDFTNNLVPANQLLSEIPFFIDDTASLSIAALRTRARRLKRSHNLGLVVVDYLQLMRGSGRLRNDNRVQEISEITQGLKALAKDLDVPVLALSQLSRAVEARDDKKPQLADLRESGAIEQDADVVMFVYREEYYLTRTEPKEGTAEHLAWQSDMEKVHNVAEIIIGKQRHGPIGNVQMAFEPDFTRFADLIRDDHLPEGG